jgi:DNA-binding MarR family transcriptional regulator
VRIEAFLSQSPIVQITRVARRVEAALDLILREEGVTFFEALVLAAIFFEKKGGIRPSQLAETFQTSRGNVSHCISSLETKGLVKRRLDPADARALRLLLEPAGRKRAVRVVGVLDRMQRHFEQSVGVGRLESMLEKMGMVEELCSKLAGI